MTAKKEKYIHNFSQQLKNGIAYYKEVMANALGTELTLKERFFNDLKVLESKLEEVFLVKWVS